MTEMGSQQIEMIPISRINVLKRRVCWGGSRP